MKNFGVKPYLFPMPTYMIGTYNEDDSVDVMMMAWGGICAEDMVALNLESEHKTVVNLEARRAFTLAVPALRRWSSPTSSASPRPTRRPTSSRAAACTPSRASA